MGDVTYMRASVDQLRREGPQRAVFAPAAGLMLMKVGRVTTCLLLLACGSELATVRLASEPTTESIEVTQPMPAALAERVPWPEERHVPVEEGRELRWADGCWLWSAGRWVWERGGWYAVTEDVARFPGRTYVTSTGQITLRPCAWLRGGRPTEAPELVLPALVPEAPRTVFDLHR